MSQLWRQCSPFWALGGLILIALAACSPPPPAPSPTATISRTPSLAQAVTATPTAAATSNELPPSWTPTFTFTPRPTRTLLPTPTPIPTFTVAQLCQFFEIVTPPSGAAFEFNAVVNFSWQGVPRGRDMQLQLIKQGEKAGLQMDVPVSGGGLFPIPLRLLPGSGTYAWRAVVLDAGYGQICEQRGTLVRNRPTYF